MYRPFTLLLLSFVPLSAQLLPPGFVIKSTAVDSSGFLYFGGDTLDPALPTTPGILQPRALSIDCGLTPPNPFSCTHGFLAKVAPSGDRLVWSTYFGAEGLDSIRAIAIAPDGSLLVSGNTTSKGLRLPGAFPSPASLFIAKVSTDGASILAGTYFGGASRVDSIAALKLDRSGNTYIAGVANSDPFPTTPGVYLREHIKAGSSAVCGGPYDQFVAKFDPTLSRLLFSTFAGTDRNDDAFDLAIGPDGSLYLAGSSGTELRLCPKLPVLTRFTPDASAAVYSAVFDIGLFSGAYALAVDSSGNAYLGADSRGALTAERGVVWRVDVLGNVAVRHDFPALIGSLGVAANGEIVVLGEAWQDRLSTTPGAPRSCLPHVRPPFLARLSPATLLPAYVGSLNSGPAWLVAPERILAARLYTTSRAFSTLAAAAPSPGTVTCLAGAGNYAGDAMAPGEVVTLFGNQIGPSNNSVEGIGVRVNGLAAPLLYAGADQINFVTPFNTPESGTVLVELSRNGALIASFEKSMLPVHAGLFTSDSSGLSTLAALNQDGSVNSLTNPASAGTAVALFATGLGIMLPQPVDGTRPPLPANRPVVPVTASVNGQPASIEYVGNAPTLIEGVVQINVRLPNPILRLPGADSHVAAIRILTGSETSGDMGSIYVN